jgi:hypothetical protein
MITCSDAVIGPEVARKYMHKLDIKQQIVITQNKLGNELYRLTAKEKSKHLLHG